MATLWTNDARHTPTWANDIRHGDRGIVTGSPIAAGFFLFLTYAAPPPMQWVNDTKNVPSWTNDIKH